MFRTSPCGPLSISIMALHVDSARIYSEDERNEYAIPFGNSESSTGSDSRDAGAGRVHKEVIAFRAVTAGTGPNARLANQRLRVLSGHAQQGCAGKRRN